MGWGGASLGACEGLWRKCFHRKNAVHCTCVVDKNNFIGLLSRKGKLERAVGRCEWGERGGNERKKNQQKTHDGLCEEAV